jgi:hypothetical protein
MLPRGKTLSAARSTGSINSVLLVVAARQSGTF